MLRTAASLLLAWLCLGIVMLMLHATTGGAIEHVPPYKVVQVTD